MAYTAGASSQGQGTATIPAPVSSAYCVPYVAQFIIDQKVLTLSSGKFAIYDPQGSLLFDVKGKMPPGLHTKRLLRDASGKVLVLLRKKNLTMHYKWGAYRGDSDSESDLLFTIGKSSLIQLTPEFDIFLPANNSTVPDFVVRGEIFKHNYSILHNNATIAEAKKKWNMASLVGKDEYVVTVYPGVDHAFIASLVVIIDQVKQDQNDSGGG